MQDEHAKNDTNPISSNILDKIMGSQTQSSLNEFQPISLVGELLSLLKERDREIVKSRFGLAGGEVETLESIGKRFALTRERVRQIEKDSIAQLRENKPTSLAKSLQLIFDTIMEHGNIMSEEFLLQTILVSRGDNAEARAVRFLLNVGEGFKNLKETGVWYESWYNAGFDMDKLKAVIERFESILTAEGHVMSQTGFFDKFCTSDYFKQHQIELTEKVLKSYLNVAKSIQINPFGEIGLKDWSEVKPRDVGDKAYLVLRHHGKPEHYSIITKMINDNKFDTRVAYQETVHNELIKDQRFVLVGRGIYALTEWGYKKGVVADVIKEILKTANHPLSREEIISEVLKRRQVKRNTILVGLSNKKNFMKVAKDKYALASTPNQ